MMITEISQTRFNAWPILVEITVLNWFIHLYFPIHFTDIINLDRLSLNKSNKWPKVGTVNFYGAIPIKQRQTAKKNVAIRDKAL